MLLGLSAPAVAEHWHNVNNRAHGLEHGSSTLDGSFFGRTYGHHFGDVNYCYVGDTTAGWYGGTTSVNANPCSVWSGAYPVANRECVGVTFNQVDGYIGISGHYHFSHYYGNCPTPI